MIGIHHQERGKGYPIILIHGFCESLEIWNQVTEILSVNYRAVAIDLPGFGKSKPLASPFTVDDVAQAVGIFLKSELGIEECIVMGHSLGGYVTLALAEQDPKLVKAFGLIHSTAYADTEERKAARLKVVEFVKAHGVKAFIDSFIPPLFADKSNPQIPAVIQMAGDTSLQTVIDYTLAMRGRPDRTDLISRTNKSLLFLAGTEDSVIPVETVNQQAKSVSRAVVTVLQHVGHMGMIEASEKTAHHIGDFAAMQVTGV